MKVSVVIPCHNGAEFLRQAVESAVVQTYEDLEIILVDDASTDGSLALMRQLLAEHVWRKFKIVRLLENHGLSTARNHGVREASGDAILPLDSDDWLHPGYLEEAVSRLAGADIVSPDRLNVAHGSYVVPGGPVIAELLPLRNQLPYCSLFKRKVWEKVGGYRRNFPVQGFEDWEFWIDAHLAGFTFAHFPGVLWYYRMRPGSMAERCLANEEYLTARIVERHPALYAAETRDWARGWLNPGPEHLA